MERSLPKSSGVRSKARLRRKVSVRYYIFIFAYGFKPSVVKLIYSVNLLPLRLSIIRMTSNYRHSLLCLQSKPIHCCRRHEVKQDQGLLIYYSSTFYHISGLCLQRSVSNAMISINYPKTRGDTLCCCTRDDACR